MISSDDAILIGGQEPSAELIGDLEAGQRQQGCENFDLLQSRMTGVPLWPSSKRLYHIQALRFHSTAANRSSDRQPYTLPPSL
ncbi:MAG: hypothetical protein VX430_04865 [Pseudomonadota bacterium]|nr:hypothetical protein [Pseudomonadota bacterium]